MEKSFTQLLVLYEAGQLSGSDLDLFFVLLEKKENQVLLANAIDEKVISKAIFPTENFELTEQAVQSLKAALHRTGEFEAPTSSPHKVHFMRRWMWAAASVVVLILSGGYIWQQQHKKPTPVIAAVKKPPVIEPGKTGAILTLSNGAQVVLDSLGNGVIATQNGTQVVLKNGQLINELKKGQKDVGDIVYNTLQTPKGRQFKVVLPDGTQVWLNAASSLKYPTAFTGNERIVEINGEAYFEVAKNAKMPFKVKVNNKAEIEVLGTHFNVNGYSEEAFINTTLLEGSVKVSSPKNETGKNNIVTIKPGQQARFIADYSRVAAAEKIKPQLSIINNVDIDKVMAWKNGAFNFEDASLEEVMKQLERWYNIKVVYEKGVPDIYFWGKMSRNINLTDLLTALQMTKVHFRVEEERTLIVMP